MNHPDFHPLRDIPKDFGWQNGDHVVIFGELFSRGYVNGLVEAAQTRGMKVTYSTVGRRDDDDRLRKLNETELAEKAQPLINVPLEAGFDLAPAKSGRTPVDQLANLKLSEWQNAKMNWTEIEESKQAGREDFLKRLDEYVENLLKVVPKDKNVLLVHTMAGGVPRAKIVMPAMNRVFKGHGERYASSEEFWSSDMGRFCASSFMDVTANTFGDFISATKVLRDRQAQAGKKVAYVAYGYHGTEVLSGDGYLWQSYSPYLQGFAKKELENIAKNATKDGVTASVYNAPEILTNSSSIFLGVEVSLYPLLGALVKDGASSRAKEVVAECLKRLRPESGVNEIMKYTRRCAFNKHANKRKP